MLNLDIDYSYFDNAILPVLKNRVKGFDNCNIKGAWAGYYDCNVLDGNPIIGTHPYYHNIIWATGFGGHGVQMAPAIGRAVEELLVESQYMTIDLTRFGWDRILERTPLVEHMRY